MDYYDGYRNYWEIIQKTKPPAIPFLSENLFFNLVPYYHDLISIYQNNPNGDDLDKDWHSQKLNFEKYYDMFSVAAELETFRLSSYHHQLRGDRESQNLLLQHIRHMSKQDDSSIGSSVIFLSGILPDNNLVLNSASGLKAIKKIVHLLSSKGVSEIE
jgi:hypothetical protein